ncbi:hypothetical protein GIB67_033363 [Kingdonia uniflora]|uniref:Protein kinase domain-containing protein n=1 Tax=Kingdonia uniflora TaxID=39325 RepID=A0A7J7LTY4_9MAGN|nr:hypothetical protein GIB67_033363 [Kingdonia uniflora]
MQRGGGNRDDFFGDPFRVFGGGVFDDHSILDFIPRVKEGTPHICLNRLNQTPSSPITALNSESRKSYKRIILVYDVSIKNNIKVQEAADCLVFNSKLILCFAGGPQHLSWSIRIKVSIDAAKGVSFLHNAESQVIYRDFKATNILLDADFNPKVSDFGLDKAGPTGDKTHVSIQVMDMQHYATPEYVATEVITMDAFGWKGISVDEICIDCRCDEFVVGIPGPEDKPKVVVPIRKLVLKADKSLQLFFECMSDSGGKSALEVSWCFEVMEFLELPKAVLQG